MQDFEGKNIIKFEGYLGAVETINERFNFKNTGKILNICDNTFSVL